jgi:hypothetical protein
MDSMAVLKENIEIARRFEPLTSDGLKELLEKTRDAARDGKYEEYKMYDPDPEDDW